VFQGAIGGFSKLCHFGGGCSEKRLVLKRAEHLRTGRLKRLQVGVVLPELG
jgi:hypothetical protein